jgi:hypothetical protein
VLRELQRTRHINPRDFRKARRYRPRRRPESRAESIRGMIGLWVGVAALTCFLTPQVMRIWRAVTTTPEQRGAIERSAYYPNCDAARAAGAAPIYSGEPGYREAMDGDSDGIACEPRPY